MRAVAALVISVLTLGAGCARPDWIQETLVTVDVTGVWAGFFGYGNASGEVRLELEQQGPKVNGYLRRLGPGGGLFPLLAGPLDGTVGGDLLSFRLTNGTATGELTVSGDEMKGYLNVSGPQPISLHRVESR